MSKFSLHSKLLEHLCDSDQEEKHRISMLELLNSPNAFSKEVQPGHFTASAFVISPNSDSLLLIYHPKLHRWLQPGGHIEDFDDSFIEAAKRELYEETGLEATVIRDLLDIDVHEIPAFRSEQAHKHYDLRTFMKATTSELYLENTKWVALSEVKWVTDDESVIRAVRKIKHILSWDDPSQN